MKTKNKLFIFPLVIMGLALLLAYSCKKDKKEPPVPVVVGQSYQGGIVVYILKSGDPGYVENEIHGIIAATSNQSDGIGWYYSGTQTTGATGTSIGTGKSNTEMIVSVQGAGSYAAKLCSDLVLGGYDDWYLPSKDELLLLFDNNLVQGHTGHYWSSSEVSFNQALSVDSYWWKGVCTSFKDGEDAVRAVRSF